MRATLLSSLLVWEWDNFEKELEKRLASDSSFSKALITTFESKTT